MAWKLLLLMKKFHYCFVLTQSTRNYKVMNSILDYNVQLAISIFSVELNFMSLLFDKLKVTHQTWVPHNGKEIIINESFSLFF